MIYGYIRVSTQQQNIDRQLDEMRKFGLKDKQIYIDKQSGKDFERAQYQKMIRKLKKDDLVVVKSIDRLGRDYHMIIEEWSMITRQIGADILVLDIPLLDTRVKPENLVGKFISDIVLQILSFVAENEREITRQRQAEGIRLARLRGIHLGRPPKPLPENFGEIAGKYINGELSNREAQVSLGMTKGTFYRNINKLKLNIKIEQSFNN